MHLISIIGLTCCALKNLSTLTLLNLMKVTFFILPLCRGFGFFPFKEAESVDKVLDRHAEDPIYIDEKMVI